jgi:hypothetical protein
LAAGSYHGVGHESTIKGVINHENRKGHLLLIFLRWMRIPALSIRLARLVHEYGELAAFVDRIEGTGSCELRQGIG